MSSNSTYLPVKKDAETIRKTVLTNIVNMLSNRKWIKKENVSSIVSKLHDIHNDDHVYKINLDVKLSEHPTYDPENKANNADFEDTIVIVKLLPQKIASLSKTPIASDFISQYKKNHKILVVDGITDKTKQNIESNRFVEIFEESFLLIDLLQHECSPEYEVLTPEEGEQMLESYKAKKKQILKISDMDPASYYLFLKKHQVIRVIRNSELTGKSIAYRIVVHKSM